jgi:catenin alpha
MAVVDHYGHPMTLKWDPKNLEIRTMSVEKTLEPLVVQVHKKINLIN